jgi:hypothetical protein
VAYFTVYIACPHPIVRNQSLRHFLHCNRIYLGAGRRLEENSGMMAAPLGMHAKLVEMTEKLLNDSENLSV